VADISDVEKSLTDCLVGALYPEGLEQASVLGVTCRIYRGWPTAAILNTDLAAGLVNVTVWPSAVPDELPPPYLHELYTSTAASGLFVTVEGWNVTLSGSVKSNQMVGLLVDQMPVVYITITGDTTASIAANLSALINVRRVALLSGSTLSIPNAVSLVGRVVSDATVVRGLRRQRREVQVSCWCPSAMLQDTVGAMLDVRLASSPFIDLSDGTKAHVCYVSTRVHDQLQNALLYRRDLCYKCEYTTIGMTIAPVMLFGDIMNDGHTLLV
jgi:hypothetical protein